MAPRTTALLLALLFVKASAGGLSPVSGSAWGFDAAARAKARYVTQPVDHFAAAAVNSTAAAAATWQQAYFINSEHWSKRGDAPVFVYIGGEGPLGGSSVTSNFIVDWLPEVGGLMLALEVRAGQMLPTKARCGIQCSTLEAQLWKRHEAESPLGGPHHKESAKLVS